MLLFQINRAILKTKSISIEICVLNFTNIVAKDFSTNSFKLCKSTGLSQARFFLKSSCLQKNMQVGMTASISLLI